MATRAHEGVGRLAVERARARIRGFLPDSVEVVELVRGGQYVLVRTFPTGIVMLDAAGRLVRTKELIVRIAFHVRAVAQVEAAEAEAQPERKLEHTCRSVMLLERSEFREALPVAGALRSLETRLEALIDERRRGGLPTERTLRRRVALLNEAARADRVVVRQTRGLAALLADRAQGPMLHAIVPRWVAARLASPDLPFYYPELDAREAPRFVEEFVAQTRR